MLVCLNPSCHARFAAPDSSRDYSCQVACPECGTIHRLTPGSDVVVDRKEPPQAEPTCLNCGQTMTPEDSRIHPEMFLHDRCIPDAAKPAPNERPEYYREAYIDDGVYVSYDGLRIWLDVRGQNCRQVINGVNGIPGICMEREVLRRVIQFAKDCGMQI